MLAQGTPVCLCSESTSRYLLLVASVLTLAGPCVSYQHEQELVDNFPKLPTLHVEGTHYQIGLAIGQAFQPQILDAIEKNTFFKEKLVPYNKTRVGVAVYSKYMQSATSLYPQYVDEIRGMADGAKLSFEELFLWNLMFEMQLLLDPIYHQLPPPSCSDLYLVNGTIRTLMGHNEDGSRLVIKDGYMINASLQNGEKFLSYCYPGELCGNAFSFTFDTQTAITINAVFPKTVDTNSVASNFLNRALISQNHTQIQQTLKEVRCSSGFSLNLGYVKSNGGLDSFGVSNFEVSPSGAVETPISGYSYHFNMYLHCPGVLQYDDPSSEHRLARIKQLHPAYNKDDILSYLGDTKDDKYPIYRTGASPDGAATIATALFDLPNHMFYVYRGNPAHTDPVIAVQTKSIVYN